LKCATVEMDATLELYKEPLSRLPAFEKKLLRNFASLNDQGLQSIISVGRSEENEDDKEVLFNIVKYLVSKGSEVCSQTWSELFMNFPTDKVKGIAKEGVQSLLTSQTTSLVYGEIDFFSFANILERASPQSGDKFVDLGRYFLLIFLGHNS
jgi:hypothetical protein